MMDDTVLTALLCAAVAALSGAVLYQRIVLQAQMRQSLEEMTAALGASGAVLHYLSYQLRRPTDHLRRISVRATENAVLIDQASQRNLDLVDSRGGVKLSLLGTLDRTSTPMGARKLRDWLLHPLDRKSVV